MSPSPAPPSLTVVLTDRGDGSRTAARLSTLAARPAPAGGYEVLVATAAPAQAVHAAVARTLAQCPGLVARVVEAAGGSTLGLRLAALEDARGSSVAFVEVDDEPGPRTVADLLASAVPTGEELARVRALLPATGTPDDAPPGAETLVFLGLTPARDPRGALLGERLGAAAVDLALYRSGDAAGRPDVLPASVTDRVRALIDVTGPVEPAWPDVTAYLSDVLPRVDRQEVANRRPYRELRSISASPLEHLAAACVRMLHPASRWTAELVTAPPGASVPGRTTQVEADTWFQLLGAGLIAAGHQLEELPEMLGELAEVVTLGLADDLVFDSAEHAAEVLARCPVRQVAARAREVARTREAARVPSPPPELVKLVVWDLDETFWRGTLAEDPDVLVPEENVRVLRELADRGIVSSICSKNDPAAAAAVLAEHGVSDLFVFPRIAFVPKGESVRQLIADMGLRAANVLFVDDNPGNLAEVTYYNPGIRTLNATRLPELLSLPGVEGKPDPGRTRLAHYRLLEERHEAQAAAASNEEFLRSSGLRVELRRAGPEDAERIHDMVVRTNQLNFTKERVTREELDALLADPDANTATVRVRDHFGDYGVVGWYYLRDGVLEHFLFSCRTLNLGIEQHVYAHLGHPRLTVVGETASDVGASDVLRDYIELEEVSAPPPPATTPAVEAGASLLPADTRVSVFALSACDLFQAIGRLALPMVDVTFECNTFRGPQRGVNTGTDYVRSCFEMSSEDQEFCRENFLNYQGRTAFATEIFDRPYDYVVLGLHDDLTYGQYRHKRRRDLVVQLDLDVRERLRRVGVGDHWAPLVDGHDRGEREPGLTWLLEEFDDEGLITPDRLEENLRWILDRLHPGTQLLLTTAPELAFFRSAAPDFQLLRERAVVLNRAVRRFCASEPRAHVVEMTDVVFERDHVTDYVMHLTAERGHALAQLVLAQVAAHPSRVLDRRAALGIGRRPVALWDANPRRAEAVRQVMTGAGIPPSVVLGDGRGAVDASTFVVAVCEEGDERVQDALVQAGWVPGTDFRIARPWVFSPDWQEGGA